MSKESILKKLKHSGLATFFKGGVHPNEHKDLTQSLPIKNYNQALKVQLHLNQHLGPPSKPIVKRGDIVKRGQVVAEAVGEGGVPVHASIYGKVVNIGKVYHPSMVEGEAILIEAIPPSNNAEETSNQKEIEPEELSFPEDSNWLNLDKEEMLSRIKQAGLVGLGGAAFPTHRKLNLPSTAKVDVLILNGAECEPYLTTDHRMMLEKGEEILLGAYLMAKIIGVNKCLVGIEDNKPDAAENLKKIFTQLQMKDYRLVLEDFNLEVHLVHTRYPQGSEKQLIQALTNRNVPARKLPMDVGVVVQNVATALSVYESIRYRKPLLDRVVTISGLGIKEPKNVRVPLGTNLSEIVPFCGGLKDNVVKIINGGPMMGRTIPGIDMPIIKGTSGFLFLLEEETYLGTYEPCIMCGKCLEACPLGLEPNRISVLVEVGQPLSTEKYGTHECFECGCCSYICPSKRPLVQFIQVSKSAYRKDQQNKEMNK